MLFLVKKTSEIEKKKNVKSLFLEMNAQEEISGVHVSENEDEEEKLFSSIMDAGSSSSTPSSTPIKMRRLSDIYAHYNFYVIEPESFEQAVQEEVWRNTMEEEIKMIKK
jgi:hypothetical protein